MIYYEYEKVGKGERCFKREIEDEEYKEMEKKISHIIKKNI